MAQLSKITEYIDKKVQEQIKIIIDDANIKYEENINQAKTQAEKEYDKIIAEANTQAENIIRMAHSATAQKSSQDILAVKIEAIDNCTNKAKEIIYNMSDDEYSKALEKLLDKYAYKSSSEGGLFSKLIKKLDPEVKGSIIFNKKDLSRITSEFSSKISKYNLVISDETANIDGGFIIRYGKIEENCTIGAIIRDEKEKLTDYISSKLF